MAALVVNIFIAIGTVGAVLVALFYERKNIGIKDVVWGENNRHLKIKFLNRLPRDVRIKTGKVKGAEGKIVFSPINDTYGIMGNFEEKEIELFYFYSAADRLSADIIRSDTDVLKGLKKRTLYIETDVGVFRPGFLTRIVFWFGLK